MICFIQESPTDFLLYYPIIKSIEDKKEYVVYDVSDKSTIDIIHFLSQNTPTCVVSYGASHRKTSIVMLCKEYEIKFINLHGDERYVSRDINPVKSAYMETISSLSYQNFVSKQGAITFLRDEGIQTPIGLFECPITHLARRKRDSEQRDVIIVFEDENKKRLIENELLMKKYSFYSYDLSKGVPNNINKLYSDLNASKFIVSDCFIFDNVSHFLGKHFFYAGNDVLGMDNLGVSTHMIDKKLELHDYLKQSWRTLSEVNPKHGIQSLLKLLT